MARLGALPAIFEMNPGVALQTAPKYLVAPGTVIEVDGQSAPLELGALAARPVLVLLKITDIIEQESLHVSIWGSADGQTWDVKALLWFPQKFYPGVTPAAIELTKRPEIRFLQARWEVNRWGRGTPRCFFKIAVEIQELAR